MSYRIGYPDSYRTGYQDSYQEYHESTMFESTQSKPPGDNEI